MENWSMEFTLRFSRLVLQAKFYLAQSVERAWQKSNRDICSTLFYEFQRSLNSFGGFLLAH